MRIGLLVLYVFSALGARYAVAQDVTRHAVPSAACIEFNQTAMNQIAVGRLEDAESTLSAALADRTNGSEQSCAWLTLHNLAIVMALSGRLAEAEVLEKRSLKILEKGYPPDDPVLLRPLQIAVVRFNSNSGRSQRPGKRFKDCSRFLQSGRRIAPWFTAWRRRYCTPKAGTTNPRPSISKLLARGRNRDVAKLWTWRRSSMV